jgi:taurine dioxygenase
LTDQPGGLRGVHRFQAPTGAAKSQAYDESVRRRELETEHPIVRVHPESASCTSVLHS